MKCFADNSPDEYIRESVRRTVERVKDYDGRVTKSHMLKRSSEKEHVEHTQEDFKISAVTFKTIDSKRLLRY